SNRDDMRGRILVLMQIEQHDNATAPAQERGSDEAEASPARTAEETRLTPAQPVTFRPMSELPAGAWRVVLLTWLAFVAVIVITFAGSKEVLFVLGVIAAFGGVFFGVPVVLARIKKRTDPTQHKPYLETLNGRVSKTEAL